MKMRAAQQSIHYLLQMFQIVVDAARYNINLSIQMCALGANGARFLAQILKLRNVDRARPLARADKCLHFANFVPDAENGNMVGDIDTTDRASIE